MSATIVFGVLVVLLGASLLLQAFNIHLPVFRVAVALLFVYVGARILLGARWATGTVGSGEAPDTAVVFSDAAIAPTSAAHDLKYTVLFGRALIDLTRLQPGPKPVAVDVAVIFGEARVRVPRDAQVAIRTSTAFGLAQTPDGHSTVFGTSEYRSAGLTPTPPSLALTVNVAFGAATMSGHEAPRDGEAIAPSSR